MLNYSLVEAVATVSVDYKKIESELKKKLSTCKLTKFKSDVECSDFYTAFFLNRLELDEELSFNDWAIIYNDLLSDQTFSNMLCFYIAMYQPGSYQGIFNGLRNAIMTDLPAAQQAKNCIRIHSDVLASLNMINRGFESVIVTVRSQINDQNAMIFCSVITQALAEMISYTNRRIQKCVETRVDPESISITIRQPISESAEAIIQEMFSFYEKEINALNETIVNTAKENANVMAVKVKKAEERIDQFIMKKWKELRRDQKNRKHAEIVGEAFRLTHEIKRVLAVAPVSLINPMVAVMMWVGSVAFDRLTDKKDRNDLVNELKDELEIIEEKITIADRKGDDKERIELIRIRQKLVRELERISHVRYEKRS